MSPIKVPANLPDLVRTTFSKARANGDVNFYATQVALLNPSPSSSPFQLRFSPSLANKPKPPPNTDKKKPFNPFENPPPALTICPLEPPAHLLVLNKFAIVPEHFLLITQTFKPQTHLLEADDLAATYACIRAYEEEEDGLFAFFNCGKHSGASQAHRHVQFLPVSRMRDGLAGEAGWEVLADRLVGANPPQLPFATFSERLNENMTPDELRTVYVRLYFEACKAANANTTIQTAWQEAQRGEGVEAAISYNLAITRTAMVLCPRTGEGGAVLDAQGNEVGKLAVNGTVLAGTALVKSEAEWAALRRDEGQLQRILGAMGIKPE